MYPLIEIEAIQYIWLVLKFINWRRQIRQNAFPDPESLQLFSMATNFIMSSLHFIILIKKYVTRKRKKRYLSKPQFLIRLLHGYRVTRTSRDVWTKLETNWNLFFWLTGETPETLSILVTQIRNKFQPFDGPGRKRVLDFRNEILLTMIWLQQYPVMHEIATLFGIHVSSVHKIIHWCTRYLHAYLVPKYIKWHTMPQWRNLQGFYPEWPNVVAILDCTPFRISKPKGPVQYIYYRKDRKCFFLNWLVIVDILGFIVLSRPGFLGRVADVTALGNVTVPVLPQGLQIMADQGFDHHLPIIVLPRANQPQLSKIMRRTFRSRRSMIERCFGILKNSYSAAGTRRFRSRRVFSSIVANLCASLYNRRRLMFLNFRRQTGFIHMP